MTDARESLKFHAEEDRASTSYRDLLSKRGFRVRGYSVQQARPAQCRSRSNVLCHVCEALRREAGCWRFPWKCHIFEAKPRAAPTVIGGALHFCVLLRSNNNGHRAAARSES